MEIWASGFTNDGALKGLNMPEIEMILYKMQLIQQIGKRVVFVMLARYSKHANQHTNQKSERPNVKLFAKKLLYNKMVWRYVTELASP